MAAWGPNSDQNDLSRLFILDILETKIYPEILKPFSCDTYIRVWSDVKHERAYFYDRFRIALDLLIDYNQKGYCETAKGYWLIAVDKLKHISNDTTWFASWNGLQDSTKSRNKRGENYYESIQKQYKIVFDLLSRSKD